MIIWDGVHGCFVILFVFLNICTYIGFDPSLFSASTQMFCRLISGTL